MSNLVLAQESFIFNSEYLLDNRFILSPSWAGYSDAFQLRLSHYQQWMGIKNSPSSQIISINGMVWNNSGLGINIYNETSAFYAQTKYEFSYAYHLDFSTKITRIISFGISGVFIQNSIDESKFTESIRDPNTTRIMVTSYSPNFNLGISYIHDNFYSSIKFDNIIPKSLKSNVNLIEPRIQNTLYLLLGYKYIYSDLFYIEPSSLLEYNTISNFLHFDLNSKFVLKSNSKINDINYSLTLSLKNNIHMKNVSTLSPLSSSIIFGARYNNYLFGMSYSYGFSEISRLGNGSLTFVLGYDFFQWYRRKLCNCNTDRYKYYN